MSYRPPQEAPQDYENQQQGPFADKPQGSENYDEAFKIQKPKFNDIIFGVFFLLVLAGFVAISGITLNAMRHTYAIQGGSIYSSSSKFTFNSNTAALFGFVVAISVVLSFLLIVLARLHARFFITSGLILNVILGLGTAIYYFTQHYYAPAIVFLVFTLITAWTYWSCRSRIPFSATVLEITIDVMKRYKSTVLTSFLGIVASGAFSAFFSMVVVATYIKYSPDSTNPGCKLDGGSCSKGKLIGVLVFVFFAGYYISEVFKNIIHVTIAGVYGTWYYLANSDQGEPKYPALGAFKRAMTYCFGSICFGSLIVSIIQLIRGLVQILRNNAFGDGDICAGCGYLILDIIISIIEWMVRYFNHYAYIYIALYGKNYITSAKETFQLIRFKGMDALINDCFVNTSIQLYSIFVAYVSALFAYLFLKFTKPEYNSDGGYYTPVLAFTFIIAGQITRVSLTVIESGISTFFVALARDPEVFQMTNRDRFDEIFRNYPQVLEKIFSKDDQQRMQQQQQQQDSPYYQQAPQHGRY
ncbi:hypothetical protein JCM33374_g1796 [Metschnikowia sp. JCM 33374]|nr:hypothetical protein JCM33374_g1796 [Metschnikowia sp. JCM 33374]